MKRREQCGGLLGSGTAPWMIDEFLGKGENFVLYYPSYFVNDIVLRVCEWFRKPSVLCLRIQHACRSCSYRKEYFSLKPQKKDEIFS